MVLSDHVGIPHESQPDLLTEAEQLFAQPKPGSQGERQTETRCRRIVHSEEEQQQKEGAVNLARFNGLDVSGPLFAGAGRTPFGFSRTFIPPSGRPPLAGCAAERRPPFLRFSPDDQKSFMRIYVEHRLLKSEYHLRQSTNLGRRNHLGSS
jgi:hypothetical protein